MIQRILVTGGAGFIGTNLSEKLLEQGQHVICLDNFCSGTAHNIKHLANHDNFEFIEHDICDPIQLEIDEIYHLACPASPRQYQNNPVNTIKTCVQGTLNILELARENQVKLFFSSTSEVYGVPTVHPQTEDYWGNVNPIGIRSCYDEGKRCAESLITNYQRQYNLNVAMLRIFNCYGPRLHIDDGRVISNFICAALLNRDIQIYGDGQQTRCFCYVDDIVTGIIASMQYGNVEPMNIGSSDELTILALAHKIIELTNSNAKIIHVAASQDDPPQRKPDLTRIENTLGWQATTDLNTGLIQTIAYFKAQLKQV